jgi:hypothetical protein
MTFLTCDSKIHFARIDLPEYPLKSSVTFPEAEPCKSKVIFGDRLMLTDEMMDILRSHGLELDFLILWTWNHFLDTTSAYQIHTDGHINRFPRGFAINWVIDGDSRVEWYSFKNGRATLTTKSGDPTDRFTITEWHYDQPPPSLACWTGNGPAMLNIRQPHAVILNGITTRRTITMRFKPNISIEEAVQRFQSRILSINH